MTAVLANLMVLVLVPMAIGAALAAAAGQTGWSIVSFSLATLLGLCAGVALFVDDRGSDPVAIALLIGAVLLGRRRTARRADCERPERGAR